MINSGIHKHIPFDVYKGIQAASFSGLTRLAQSPAHYKDYLLNPPKPTASMAFGTAVHSAVLEEGLEKGKVVCAPDVDKRTKAGKSEWEAFQAAHQDSIIVSVEDFEAIKEIKRALSKHETASSLLNPNKGISEVSALWNDPVSGVLCKCRADRIRSDGIIIDIKTTQNASAREFQKSIGTFKYHWQSAFYLDGFSLLLGDKLSQFVHIAIESEPPYGIGVFVLDDVSLTRARSDITFLLALYSICEKENRWPNYPDEIQNISIPSWAW
jgi:hypothetical protein